VFSTIVAVIFVPHFTWHLSVGAALDRRRYRMRKRHYRFTD
jgi:hypothetical protein